jgi:CheY-like chemotaxis protein
VLAARKRENRRFGGPILVVDDNAEIREAMAIDLQTVGFDVRLAVNGADGLRAAREWPRPNLILLDLMMPVMDGWTFREQQLADRELRRIPVILFSARGDAARHGRVLHAAASLEKPVDLDRLHQVIEQVCAAA